MELPPLTPSAAAERRRGVRLPSAAAVFPSCAQTRAGPCWRGERVRLFREDGARRAQLRTSQDWASQFSTLKSRDGNGVGQALQVPGGLVRGLALEDGDQGSQQSVPDSS